MLFLHSADGIKNQPNEGAVIYILLYTVLPLIGISIIVTVIFWIYRQRRMEYFNEVPTTEPSPLPPPSPPIGLLPIQLLEIKARGRFGAVWKAQLMSDCVAVKILPVQVLILSVLIISFITLPFL